MESRSQPAQPAFLIFEDGVLAGRKMELDGPSLVIGRGGRNQTCEIQIALCARFRFVGADATLPLEEIHPVGRLRLDRLAKRVWIGSAEISPPLSPAQYRLLELLYDPVGQVRSRDEIIDIVWAEVEREGVTEQAIDALVRRLRERLSEADPDGTYVITVRGHGFRLDVTGGH
jgi:DNA-binding response OmpR family regulator